jgi:hypothetical protein
MESEKINSKTSQFFYRNWWLFYLLIFVLIGLIFFIGCNPKHNSDLTSVHAKLSTLEDQIECGLKQKEQEAEQEYQQSPVNTIPCDSGPTYSGGQGYTENHHELGSSGGIVTVNYDMQNVPDQIDVLYNGTLVASSKSLISGEGSLSWRYNPIKGGPTYCIVRISAPEDGTVWTYNLGCPQ